MSFSKEQRQRQRTTPNKQLTLDDIQDIASELNELADDLKTGRMPEYRALRRTTQLFNLVATTFLPSMNGNQGWKEFVRVTNRVSIDLTSHKRAYDQTRWQHDSQLLTNFTNWLWKRNPPPNKQYKDAAEEVMSHLDSLMAQPEFMDEMVKNGSLSEETVEKILSNVVENLKQKRMVPTSDEVEGAKLSQRERTQRQKEREAEFRRMRGPGFQEFPFESLSPELAEVAGQFLSSRGHNNGTSSSTTRRRRRGGDGRDGPVDPVMELAADELAAEIEQQQAQQRNNQDWLDRLFINIAKFFGREEMMEKSDFTRSFISLLMVMALVGIGGYFVQHMSATTTTRSQFTHPKTAQLYWLAKLDAVDRPELIPGTREPDPFHKTLSEVSLELPDLTQYAMQVDPRGLGAALSKYGYADSSEVAIALRSNPRTFGQSLRSIVASMDDDWVWRTTHPQTMETQEFHLKNYADLIGTSFETPAETGNAVAYTERLDNAAANNDPPPGLTTGEVKRVESGLVVEEVDPATGRNVDDNSVESWYEYYGNYAWSGVQRYLPTMRGPRGRPRSSTAAGAIGSGTDVVPTQPTPAEERRDEPDKPVTVFQQGPGTGIVERDLERPTFEAVAVKYKVSPPGQSWSPTLRAISESPLGSWKARSMESRERPGEEVQISWSQWSTEMSMLNNQVLSDMDGVYQSWSRLSQFVDVNRNFLTLSQVRDILVAENNEISDVNQQIARLRAIEFVLRQIPELHRNQGFVDALKQGDLSREGFKRYFREWKQGFDARRQSTIFALDELLAERDYLEGRTALGLTVMKETGETLLSKEIRQEIDELRNSDEPQIADRRTELIARRFAKIDERMSIARNELEELQSKMAEIDKCEEYIDEYVEDYKQLMERAIDLYDEGFRSTRTITQSMFVLEMFSPANREKLTAAILATDQDVKSLTFDQIYDTIGKRLIQEWEEAKAQELGVDRSEVGFLEMASAEEKARLESKQWELVDLVMYRQTTGEHKVRQVTAMHLIITQMLAILYAAAPTLQLLLSNASRPVGQLLSNAIGYFKVHYDNWMLDRRLEAQARQSMDAMDGEYEGLGVPRGSNSWMRANGSFISGTAGMVPSVLMGAMKFLLRPLYFNETYNIQVKWNYLFVGLGALSMYATHMAFQDAVTLATDASTPLTMSNMMMSYWLPRFLGTYLGGEILKTYLAQGIVTAGQAWERSQAGSGRDRERFDHQDVNDMNNKFQLIGSVAKGVVSVFTPLIGLYLSGASAVLDPSKMSYFNPVRYMSMMPFVTDTIDGAGFSGQIYHNGMLYVLFSGAVATLENFAVGFDAGNIARLMRDSDFLRIQSFIENVDEQYREETGGYREPPSTAMQAVRKAAYGGAIVMDTMMRLSVVDLTMLGVGLYTGNVPIVALNVIRGGATVTTSAAQMLPLVGGTLAGWMTTLFEKLFGLATVITTSAYSQGTADFIEGQVQTTGVVQDMITEAASVFKLALGGTIFAYMQTAATWYENFDYSAIVTGAVSAGSIAFPKFGAFTLDDKEFALRMRRSPGPTLAAAIGGIAFEPFYLMVRAGIIILFGARKEGDPRRQGGSWYDLIQTVEGCLMLSFFGMMLPMFELIAAADNKFTGGVLTSRNVVFERLGKSAYTVSFVRFHHVADWRGAWQHVHLPFLQTFFRGRRGLFRAGYDGSPHFR